MIPLPNFAGGILAKCQRLISRLGDPSPATPPTMIDGCVDVVASTGSMHYTFIVSDVRKFIQSRPHIAMRRQGSGRHHHTAAVVCRQRTNFRGHHDKSAESVRVPHFISLCTNLTMYFEFRNSILVKKDVWVATDIERNRLFRETSSCVKMKLAGHRM